MSVPGAGVVAAGPLAEHMNRLGWQLTWLGTAVFGLVVMLLVIGMFRRPPAGGGRPLRTWIVGGGVVLSTVLIGLVFALTLMAMRATSLDTTNDSPRVQITGHQWWWEIEYPDHNVVTANELHIPAGVPIEMNLRSNDVIHSFWVPEIGGKIDLLPDDVNTYVIQADEPGVYQGVCAEFCGLQHARMRFLVVAQPVAEFEAWLEQQRAPSSSPTGEQAQKGERIFMVECARCHSILGTDASGDEGPDLSHVASRRTLGAGTIENSSEHLRQWIEDPGRFKPGVLMPRPDLTARDLGDLAVYLEGLR